MKVRKQAQDDAARRQQVAPFRMRKDEAIHVNKSEIYESE